MKSFVFDASPIIYLSKAKVLEKIRFLQTKNIVTKTIYNEIVEEGKKKGHEDAFYFERLVDEGLFEVVEVKNLVKAINQNPNLHKGDVEVLSFAKNKNSIAVIDEEEGRKVADIEEIRCVGSVYILFKLLKLNKISKKELRLIMDKMIEFGWRCSTELYAYILKMLEE